MNLGYKTDRKAVERERDRGKAAGRFYTFKNGKTVIRVMPAYSEAGVWFKRVCEYFFKIDDEIFSPTAPNDRAADPIRGLASKLFKTGDEQMIELAKKLNPRTRFLVNAVVIQDPEEGASLLAKGVQVVALPIRIKEQLVELDTDEDAGYADITDVEQGFNIIVEKSGKGLDTRYTLKPMRERTNVVEAAKEKGVDVSQWSVNNLDAFVNPDAESTLTTILDKFLRSDPLALKLGVTRENPFGGPPQAAQPVVQATAAEMQDAPTKSVENSHPQPAVPAPPPSAAEPTKPF